LLHGQLTTWLKEDVLVSAMLELPTKRLWQTKKTDQILAFIHSEGATGMKLLQPEKSFLIFCQTYRETFGY